jgi:two-component system NtrC family sensor kinase
MRTELDHLEGADAHHQDAVLAPRRYRQLRRNLVISTATVSLLPLAIMAGINYLQYQRAFRSEATQPVTRLTVNTHRALEFFLQERESALRMIVNERSFAELCQSGQLARTLRSLKKSLSMRAFVDLGLVDAQGIQRCYTGPYALTGKDYKDQDWFHRVRQQGIHLSEVFLGYRQSPHFVIAIRHEGAGGDDYILRATLDAEMLSEQILAAGLGPKSDAFLVNRQNVLQTSSRRYGPALNRCPLPLPTFPAVPEVMEREDERGERIFLGYAPVKNSPFALLLVERTEDVLGGWFRLRAELLGFLAVSSIVILAVVLVASRKLVRRIQEADMARASLFHKMEYTNKLASLGRLAAGVSHEINNPLAIINEKAGLLADLVKMGEDFPRREKTLSLLDSILKSVERCSTVTHRLLGFAKHMDVQSETIDVDGLLREVLGFLEKEAAFRNLQVVFDVAPDLPTIRSDRGQIQQVFLNIINNAFAAVEEGGRVEISISRAGNDAVAVSIADNGVGISEDNLKRIFEPFFTTKKGAGTGLGLSVTYGIVQKLGGQISVESKVGQGTRFTVRLPIRDER